VSGGADDRAGDDPAAATGGDAPESLRLAALRSLQPTPRRREVRRLAAAMRDVIEHLVSTTATTEELAAAADELEELAGRLADLPGGQTYQGFAETAVAGGLASLRQQFPGSGTELARDDPERFAFFDHSPFIGLANPLSPPMHLVSHADRVVGTAVFGAAYEGPPGCVHGGYVAAAFDELLGAAQSLSGTQGMTAHLGVDYRSPTPLQAELHLEGWLERREGRKIWTRGTIHADGRLTAEAEALFIAFDPGRFRELLDARDPAGPTEG
jgi:acyl-coenzyme A thioesterase PaaI-like protein